MDALNLNLLNLKSIVKRCKYFNFSIFALLFLHFNVTYTSSNYTNFLSLEETKINFQETLNTFNPENKQIIKFLSNELYKMIQNYKISDLSYIKIYELLISFFLAFENFLIWSCIEECNEISEGQNIFVNSIKKIYIDNLDPLFQIFCLKGYSSVNYLYALVLSVSIDTTVKSLSKCLFTNFINTLYNLLDDVNSDVIHNILTTKTIIIFLFECNMKFFIFTQIIRDKTCMEQFLALFIS